ncbi:hypothetical protein H310_05362 [Aphanomyces invadans]|uniref:Uncharacterized protein n=1 Tax=Aphanomyces invadans TaxID=157072 RepID=A0A024U939_9STRA|nr:hypothetical protein H310_05362 [Aphanomyces invadans]ETW02896.1 hypothetical protein H310_05362 [Aphanomyces invadans]|eukprot:XP_008868280.1 hypothetical protein H310_05362 [Aphanomyces invadans]
MHPAPGMARTFVVLGDVEVVVVHLHQYVAQLAIDSQDMIQVKCLVVVFAAWPCKGYGHTERASSAREVSSNQHLLPCAGISRLTDLILDPLEAAAFLNTPIVCQEKVDGRTPDFQVVAQNRSHFDDDDDDRVT